MSIVDGKGLVSWEGGLFTPDSALLPRVRWAFAQIRAEGGDITLNEAGRPFGVPGDADVEDSSQTASGLSTVWYQWGRYQRGETPSAANPAGGAYASEHTQGIAIDCNANPTSLRAKYFPMVGLANTISSESWHWAIRGPSNVDLSDYQYAGQNITPISPEEDDMTPEQAKTLADLAWTVGQIKGSVDSLMGAGPGNEGGKGPVNAKLDTLLWANTDEKVGLRTMVGSILQKLTGK